MKKEHIEKAYEALDILVKKSINNMNNASFVGVFDKKDNRFYIGHGCHYSLRQLGTGTVAIVSRISPYSSALIDKTTKEYYSWLFNDSPWADVFVIKDAKEAMKLKAVICNTNLPSNYVAGAIFASRAWQGTNSINTFIKIIEDKKVSKNLAFIGSLWCSHTRLFRKKYYILDKGKYSGNSAISNNYQSLEFVKNFVDKKLVLPRKDFCDNPYYKGETTNNVYKTWHRRNDPNEEFINLLTETFKNKKFEVSIKDPLSSRKYNYTGSSNEEAFIARLVYSLKKIQKGMKIEA